MLTKAVSGGTRLSKQLASVLRVRIEAQQIALPTSMFVMLPDPPVRCMPCLAPLTLARLLLPLLALAMACLMRSGRLCSSSPSQPRAACAAALVWNSTKAKPLPMPVAASRTTRTAVTGCCSAGSANRSVKKAISASSCNAKHAPFQLLMSCWCTSTGVANPLVSFLEAALDHEYENAVKNHVWQYDNSLTISL